MVNAATLGALTSSQKGLGMLRMLFNVKYVAPMLLCATSALTSSKPVVIDTDIFSDVDDVGALAVANVLHNHGMANIRGVMINSNSIYGAQAAGAVNTFFGNGDIPIAAMRPLTDAIFVDRYRYKLSDYASKIAHHWPHGVKDAGETPTPVDLYRSVLASAENKSITIISIGFLTNLAGLLDSHDDGLSGPELVATKVRELVVMGGRYPSGWEYNLGGVDPTSAAIVIDRWPREVPITFSGYELGKYVLSGEHLRREAPPASPVLAAYEWYVGRCKTLRESWDPLTVLYGVAGLDELPQLGLPALFKYGNEYGYNSVASKDGSNIWVNDTNVTNQHWLKLADNVSNNTVAWILEQFYKSDASAQTFGDLALFTQQ